MRKNGFTLIELLAVIVILAIIALIATPIILGIINDVREKANERSVELYASAIKNGIAAYQLREMTEVEAGTYTTETLPFEVEYDGNVDCESIIISKEQKVSLEVCTVNGGTKEYSYDTKKETSKVCTLEDNDGDRVASLSDVITCAGESFYVMSNENGKITMLSMYNLNVGNSVNANTWETTPLENATGIQDPESGFIYRDSGWYGTLRFSETAYWLSTTASYPAFVYNENSDLYPYVSEYESYLKENGVSSASATIINYDQLNLLGLLSGCLSEVSWACSTTYWTGYADESTVFLVLSESGIYSETMSGKNFDADETVGLRPVITISTSDLS